MYYNLTYYFKKLKCLLVRSCILQSTDLHSDGLECLHLLVYICLESFSDIFMTFFPSSCDYFNNFFMFTLSSAAGPSTSSSSDDTLPKETDSPKCFKEKRKRPRSELTDFFLERNQKNRIRNLSCSWIKWKNAGKEVRTV